MAVAEFGGQVAGRPITILTESTDAIPDTAYFAAQKLIEKKGVDVLIGPLSGDEGMAVKEYAFTRPDRTFLNGIAGTQDITLRNPAPNFFNFIGNAAQWIGGLGSYVYEKYGYRKVVTLAEAYSYPFTQVGAFIVDFQRAGGRVLQKLWGGLGTTDFSHIIAEIPPDIDAIFVCLAGTDAIKFLEQYLATGRQTPLIGGSTLVDQTVLSVTGELSDQLIGMPWSGPCCDHYDDPDWQAFVAAYRNFGTLHAPGLFTLGYYVNTKAVLLAVQILDGRLDADQTNLRAALSALQFHTPTGMVRLDHKRQAITPIFINAVERDTDGSLSNRILDILPEVNSTLGIPEDEYLAIGPFDRDNPPTN